MVRVKVWCAVDEIEDEKKVVAALKRLFPTLNFRIDEIAQGSGRKKDVEFLKELIWSRRILDTVRQELLRHRNGDHTRILLHKQAAYAGKVSLVESDDESPLGAIHIEFSGKDLDDFVDWLAPKTKDGRPILQNQRHS